MSTLFQNSAGTTPVTAVEQPVGRMLDKSGRGNHATQATSAARPVLSARVNILLATDTLATQSVTTVATTYTLAFSGTGSITLSGTKTGTFSAGTHSVTGVTAGTLTLTVSGTVTNADLRVANDGVNLPAYQRVNTATDYDTAGFPMYLRFDGVDDRMLVADNAGLRQSNMTFWLGINSQALASREDWLTNGNAQFFGGNNYIFGNSATSINILPRTPASIQTAGSLSAQTPIVFSALYNGSSVDPRVNGVNRTSVTCTFGTDETSGMFIGANNLPGSFFAGRIYIIIVRGAATDATAITNTETWINGKTRAFA